MRPSIFISRDESRSHDFLDIVKPLADEITCKSLIDFSMIIGGALPNEGWLFFYSQTGVDFFLKQYSLSEVESKGLMIAAFGPKTGQYLRNQNLKTSFVGTGEARTTAESFLLVNQNSSVCFIKGSTSKDSLSPILIGRTAVTSIKVYNNIGKLSFNLPASDILVFTSPLNLETYFTHYPHVVDQKVVAIGTSTALSALEMGFDEVHIAKLPSLESLAALVVKLCATWNAAK